MYIYIYVYIYKDKDELEKSETIIFLLLYNFVSAGTRGMLVK